jgi:hypothetical protein
MAMAAGYPRPGFEGRKTGLSWHTSPDRMTPTGTPHPPKLLLDANVFRDLVTRILA